MPVHNRTTGRSNSSIPVIVVCLVLPVLLSACTSILGNGNWQAAGLQQRHIRVLEVDPNDAEKIYAGDTQGSVLVSVDAAQHWSEHSSGLPLPNPIHALSFNTDGKRLYAATDKGIFISVDAAVHWNSLDTPASGLVADSYTSLAIDLNAAHTLYAGTAHHGVYTSTNDGQSWTSLSHDFFQNTTVNSLTFDTDQHQLWAATSHGIMRSDDRGVTWHALNTGLPTGNAVNMVIPASIHGGATGLVYAGTQRGFFLSQDAGKHWTASQDSLSRVSILSIQLDFRTSNASTVYVGTTIGALSSADSGQHWGSVAHGMPRDEPVYALTLGASNYAQLIAATDSDIYLFPGNGGGFDLSRILFILVSMLFLVLLYLLLRRNQQRRRDILKPERIIEQPSTPTPER